MAKASDNPFPSALFVEGAAPASPAAGRQRLFIDSADGALKRVDSAGTVTSVEGGAAAASDVSFTPAGDLAATDVQAAIEELDSEKVSVSGSITKVDGPMTQAEYDAIVTPAADTLYVIVG